MKKMFLMLMAVLLLLGVHASAEMQRYQLDSMTVIGQGDSRMPWYPDYSSRFGTGMTRDDFNISYVAMTGKDILVAKNGVITVPDDLATGIYYMGITYKHKYSTRSQSFTNEVQVIKPVNKLDISDDPIYLSVGGSETMGAPINYHALSFVSFDPDIITVSRGRSMSNTLLVTVKGVATGKTEMILETYNGIVKVIPVEVVGPETKVEFASDHFYGYVGDVIDLGTDLGNGENGTKVTWNLRYSMKRNGERYSRGGTYYYDRFEATETGEYDLTISTGDGLSGSTKISIYDRADCASIEVEHGAITVGAAKRIVLRDAQGNEIWRPVSITAGGNCARLEYDEVTGLTEGEVTITVRNEDGSTISQTFPVLKTPTISDRETMTITLEIGETFDLIPDFGVPASECRYTYYDIGSPENDLSYARLEGSTIIAQAPGKGEVSVSYENMYAKCYVIVPDSDLAVDIVMPEEPLGVGETFQLTVQDRTGKVYPATFYSSWSAVDVTKDGLMTGAEEGYYEVRATLADGRKLSSLQAQVVQRPSWMTHPTLTALLSDGSVTLQFISSDVGSMGWSDVTIEVADPAIATVKNGTFTLHQAGSTVVTLTAVYGGATTSFTMEVLESEKLFIGAGTIRVPYGYAAQLPQVTNAKGQKVTVTWAITHDVPGEGNTAASGFILEDDTIACVWPYASCELTGTSVKGERVKLTVQGYMIVEEIWLNQTEMSLEVNRSAELVLRWDEAEGEPGDVGWFVEDPAVVSVSGADDSTPHTITINGLAVGTSRVAVMLGNGAYAECLVTVTDPNARMPGDANEDGVVDEKDALLVMQRVAGWNVTINGYAGDVNADGATTLEDAILIFQYGSGLDVQLKRYVPES